MLPRIRTRSRPLCRWKATANEYFSANGELRHKFTEQHKALIKLKSALKKHVEAGGNANKTKNQTLTTLPAPRPGFVTIETPDAAQTNNFFSLFQGGAPGGGAIEPLFAPLANLTSPEPKRAHTVNSRKHNISSSRGPRSQHVIPQRATRTSLGNRTNKVMPHYPLGLCGVLHVTGSHAHVVARCAGPLPEPAISRAPLPAVLDG